MSAQERGSRATPAGESSDRPGQRTRWQFFIDRGGTFTDCLGLDPSDGQVRVLKLLSSDRAPLDGIRRLLGLPAEALIPPCDVRMGTTLATNALLERKGVETALAITEGFGDLLLIGDQSRPELFELDIRRPAPLYSHVLELPARCDADGSVRSRPERERTLAQLRDLRTRGARSLAVSFLHAYRAAELELEVGAWAREVGFEDVALSHEVAAELGLLARTDTTVLDAYLTPLLRSYVRALLSELPASSLRIMQSSGGLTDAATFRGRDAVLSGPAGGGVAVARVAERLGLEAVIGFDMGGTSTDVTRYAGELERVYEMQLAGVRLRTPMMRIHTVAAGGGSICRYEGGRFTVGPESAGALPGPLCYGHPGASDITLTDAALVLGWLKPDRLPLRLDEDRAVAAFEALARRLRAEGDARGPHAVAEGFCRVAVEHMAEAIRRVSIARGHDVREHALVAFGGAAGQHVCALARLLGIREIVLHPLAGVLSAYGMACADVSAHAQEDAGRVTLDGAVASRTQVAFERIERTASSRLTAQGVTRAGQHLTRRADLRYAGSESPLTLEFEPIETLSARFEAAHQALYGYCRPGHPIELATLRVEALARARSDLRSEARSTSSRAALRRSPIFHEGSWRQAAVYAREDLAPGDTLAGPAIVLEDVGTILVEPGFRLGMGEEGVMTLSLERPAETRKAASTASDPVLLEVFGNHFMAIAEQMGVVLQRTALSTNIRERLDFSCAVFDKSGALVANAPHIPVHLGAMSETVRAIYRQHPQMRPGDAFVTNDPALGGSHLPDVTVIAPVFAAGGELTFFTANRGHHADIGGLTPGSMPPASTRLEEEGVVLRGLHVVREDRFDEELLRRALLSGPFPVRAVEQNLADLSAQLAAVRTGERLLHELVARYGLRQTLAYMGHVQDNADARVREAIGALSPGEHAFEDVMDDGTRIAVVLRIAGDRMHVDFSGSSAQVAGNLNAPRAVTVAAVLYVLRTLVGKPIPLNSGCLRPITLVIPEPSVLCPGPGAAVVAGNVETSQRVVDVLLGALGRLAACQGTMNNLTFGDSSFGYYETIAGGAGAGPGHPGASGVHTHMTNTKITDPEVLESRYPVRLERFGLRAESGGKGEQRGGDGVIRELTALRTLSVSILSDRRVRPPFGVRGGEPGACGRNLLNGRELGARATFELSAGDRLCIETPGGGGYGAGF